MIHPHLFPSSVHPPLTEAQKQVWKTSIRNQPSKVNPYRRTPVENYNLLKINELVYVLKTNKTPRKFEYLGAFFLLGLSWRFDGIDWFTIAPLTWIIHQQIFTTKSPWYLKVAATGISIPFNDEHKNHLEIPFQQIICMDYEQYYDKKGDNATELVIYYAYHSGGYLAQRVAIVGNEADTMGIIHYFLNQYQNALPQKP